ncbi:polyprenyl diphosphate synthase [Candidatus Njordibacter sp. Uisw_056]|jgi:undecaprenyl diphosphate synthase|uniref:polyprenyl diphosphate synthase n=1 Tax=Candidatus Njordibacter sp. Uisw_056 TaxID=3230973 RepID=UPI003D406E5F|tara:strand:+ start:3201 stop:3971 length:771 start_codon:yes stop_codon:yes gene_type:complete
MTDPRQTILARKLEALPEHIAIIMDGNNRWAKNHSLSGVAGHKAGVDAVRAVIETAVHYEIPALTLFAFSSENWRRPPLEVKALMDLFVYVLKREVDKLHDNNIRLRIIGNTHGLSAELQKLIVAAETKTMANTGLQLSIAANYGGRWDILEAAKKLASEIKDNGVSPDSVSEDDFGKYLCLGDLPGVDLCIRTSGEQRISNFLLWQMAYAEFVFVDTLWPEFKHQKMVDTLVQFGQRQRRFGQTGAQLVEQKSNV